MYFSQRTRINGQKEEDRRRSIEVITHTVISQHENWQRGKFV